MIYLYTNMDILRSGEGEGEGGGGGREGGQKKIIEP